MGRRRAMIGRRKPPIQLVKNGNFADTSEWHKTEGTIDFSASNNVGTVTFLSRNGSPALKSYYYSMASGQKYYSTITVKVENGQQNYMSAYRRNIGYGVIVTSDGEWHKFEWFDNKDTGSNRSVGACLRDGYNSFPYTCQIKNTMCIDLTATYGAGNEPTTIAQFRADYPDEYYEYNPL